MKRKVQKITQLDHWNFRVMSHLDAGEEWVGIHEVYYDENGFPSSYSIKPQAIVGEDLKSLKWFLDNMKKALSKRILTEDDFNESPKKAEK